MATEHYHIGDFKVMSEKEDNCPHNLTDTFLDYSILSVIGIILFGFLWIIYEGLITWNPAIDNQVCKYLLAGLLLICLAMAITLFIIQHFLPKGCGVRIYIKKGNGEYIVYSSNQCYYQYTNNNEIDAQNVLNRIAIMEQRARELYEEQQTIDAEKQVCCNKHQDVMSQVNRGRNNGN